MRSILAFLAAFAGSILVTWAGLHYDNALFYVGVSLSALVFILFMWSWAFAKPESVPALQQFNRPPEPEPKDDNERALLSLKRARDNAAIALHNRGEERAHKALNEILAAMLSVKRQYGIGQLNFTEANSYRAVVTAYLHFIDEIYPRLREGHIEQARAKAKAFRWGY